uniref:Uncharacterized protein n=1 Tax=Arundo donax TaxID=35708 RepID=A0A0A9D1W8_ARUDO
MAPFASKHESLAVKSLGIRGLVSYTKDGTSITKAVTYKPVKSDGQKLYLKISSISPDKLKDVSACPCIYHLALVLQHLLLGTGIAIQGMECYYSYLF